MALYKKLRMWRNGRRESFKSFSPQGGVGSSPIIRIFFLLSGSPV